MNIYENIATQSITSFFYNESLWKKEILFNFLLKPFNLQLSDIIEIKAQDNLKETIPDFTIVTSKSTLRYEVKTNNSGLTYSEHKTNSRDAYLIRKHYCYLKDIPVNNDKILFWEDLFKIIDKKGAASDFARLNLIREYMHEDINTLLLTPHEVAMLYSPETIVAIYRMKEKIKTLCENFLNSKESKFKIGHFQDDAYGIGYYFDEKVGKKRSFFVGLSPSEKEYFSVAKLIDGANDSWDFYELDKEILAKCNSDEEIQEEFNKNVEDVMKAIE